MNDQVEVKKGKKGKTSEISPFSLFAIFTFLLKFAFQCKKLIQ